MKNFSKSILNYFATYNETRFRFNTRIAQKWTGDNLTLDISIFPEFQKEIVAQISQKKLINISIKKNQHQIYIDFDLFSEEIQKLVDNVSNQNTLDEIKKDLLEKLPEDERLDESEVYRKHAIIIRKEIGKILLELQEIKKQELVSELDITHLPLSTLNTTSIEQQAFDEIIKISHDIEQDYLTSVNDFLKNDFKPNLAIYDLYILLNTYNRFVSAQTLYIYLHEFILKDESYPLLSVEVELKPNGDEFSVNSSRDLIFINTPVINSAKIGSVLTTPRACKNDDIEKYVNEMEMYLNGYYKNTNSFILKDSFTKKVGKDLPEIKPRVGFQIVPKEDRKILDYSELITQIESGAGKKFGDLVQTYVESNVENTANEVNTTYNSEFPTKSYKNLISDIPLSLNKSQRKILTAAKNEKNKIMVIDGPPGTGKSYTITALVYLANLLNKKILITSHKKQALDVVESKLIEQFHKVHPNAKPPILRLTKNEEDSLNSISNTLSSAVINATHNRHFSFKEDLVKKDKDETEKLVEKINKEFWENGLKYPEQIKNFEKFEDLHDEIVPKSVIPTKKKINIEWQKFVETIKNIVSSNPGKISLDQLFELSNNIGQFESWIQACEQLHGLNFERNIKQEVSSSIDLNELNNKMSKLFNSLEDDVRLGLVVLDKIKLIDKNKYSESIQWKKFQQITKLIENLNKSNTGLSKFIGSKTKRELEYSLELDFPEIFKDYKKIGSEKLLFELNALERKISDFKNEVNFLKSEYVYSQPHDLEELREIQKYINSIEYEPVFKAIANHEKVSLSEITIEQLRSGLENLMNVSESKKLFDLLRLPLQIFNNSENDIKELYSNLKENKDLIESCDPTYLKMVLTVLNHYKDSWDYLGVNADNLLSFKNILEFNEKFEKVKEYINLHQLLSDDEIFNPDLSQISKYSQKAQRILEYKNEKRFSGLLNHGADVQRILNTVGTGKRLTEEEAQVLFENIPCIIAPTDLISQYFPMKEDMIDWLIIDESSQVSIAESLSLMLRAKQSMVFGDELQYGAVGATNVSLEYSKQYFRNVLDDYVLDKNDSISEDDLDRLASEVSASVEEEDVVVPEQGFYKVNPATKEWLKTFSIRTSTLDFAKALANYTDSLDVHFRSYPEIISYSNKTFYQPTEINLITSRIRTKPINDVLQFIKVESKGLAGENINLDEIEVIKNELQKLFDSKYSGSIGIICSFQEQTSRLKEDLRKDLPCYAQLRESNKLEIWFVGEVQGEERDVVFYSFVADKSIGNARLNTIYPVIEGKADDIRNLRMQRLNVGFSRAKDKMVFVHSMELNEYKDTRLGDALEYYNQVLNDTKDHYIEDTSIFDSPAEEELYSLIIQTEFYQKYKNSLKLIAQFEMGKYLKEEFRRHVPKYRVDFLLTYSANTKEVPLIIEYDGLEFHTKNPHAVNSTTTFDQEYLEYDVQRQLEIESYGYQFLRINKFTLVPRSKEETKVDVLNNLLYVEFMPHLHQLDEVMAERNKSTIKNTSYDSIQEKKLEEKIKQTEFFQKNSDKITLVSQYQVGDYIREKYNEKIGLYEADFLLSYRKENEDIKLLIEYDGADFHDKEYDEKRDEQISKFGFKFLRINKNIFAEDTERTDIEQLNELLINVLEK